MKSLLFLIILLNITLVSGQSRFRLGVRGGMNYVNNVYKFNDLGESGNEYRTAYHLGVQGKFKVLERFYFSPEISWSNKGYYNPGINRLGTFDGPFAAIHFLDESNTHLNYISVPLTLEFRPISLIGIQLGPEISYLISAKAEIDSDKVELLETWKLLNIVNRFDFGLMGGIDVSIFKNISVGVRYVQGFTSLFHGLIRETVRPGDPIVTERKPKNQNRTYQVSVSYFIFD